MRELRYTVECDACGEDLGIDTTAPRPTALPVVAVNGVEYRVVMTLEADGESTRALDLCTRHASQLSRFMGGFPRTRPLPREEVAR